MFLKWGKDGIIELLAKLLNPSAISNMSQRFVKLCAKSCDKIIRHQSYKGAAATSVKHLPMTHVVKFALCMPLVLG